MFGYMLFKNGDNHRTPDEFQRRARQDVETHIQKFKTENNNALVSTHNNDEMDVDTEYNNNNSIDNNINYNYDHNNNNINNLGSSPQNTLHTKSHIENINKHSASPLLRSLKRTKLKKFNKSKEKPTPHTPLSPPLQSQNNISNVPKQAAYTPSLTYGSSPLRQTVAASTIIDSSDECSSIDSGKSGCSLTHESAQQLLQQQQESLERMLTTNSTLHSSIFSNDLNSLYTHDTISTNDTITDDNTNYNDSSVLALNQALPTDYTDYYSPDLDVDKFSNGRPTFTKRPLKNWELNDLRSLLIYPELNPKWHNKIPKIRSPYPNMDFRIQIIPNYLADNEIINQLANSDIYKEANFEINFKLKTAGYIVERARLRHKQILIDSFGLNPNSFIENSNLLGNIQYDCYFKFEWRNIIENYLLNLGIEYECRCEFKSRISKLKKITQEKISTDSGKSIKSSAALKNDLYKKVLLENKSHITEDVKMGIWKDVQSQIYKKLNMDGWNLN